MSPNHSRDKQHVLLVKKTEVFCKCQDSVTCHYISSPFSLEKVTPAVLGSSSDHPRLHSSVFMHSAFFFFTFFMLFYLLNPPFPLPPENPYIAYWTLWKHSQRNSLFMVLQELLFHDSTIFTLIWQWHLQQTLPRIVYLQWHLKMLSIWGFALWTQTYISDMLSGR